MMTAICLFSEQETTKGDRPLRGLLTIVFQDHAVLEPDLDFRIILRLENAPRIDDSELPTFDLYLPTSRIVNESGTI